MVVIGYMSLKPISALAMALGAHEKLDHYEARTEISSKIIN